MNFYLIRDQDFNIVAGLYADSPEAAISRLRNEHEEYQDDELHIFFFLDLAIDELGRDWDQLRDLLFVTS